ncbi:MAG: glycosyltransferase [Deltaproteobacteria bacterium]|nr:glycosyltransferase [Deltaproteobacteria bacterium]
MTPLCSVCIANYNGVRFIRECIDSVIRQTCSFAVEIIVHDDASTDASAELIAREYPEVRLISSPENAGFCVANNRMVDLALGKFILLLNNDAVLMPDALEVLASGASMLPPQAILSLAQYDADSHEMVDLGSFLDPFLNSTPRLNPGGRAPGMVSGACLWLPRTLLKELGGFPACFHALAEDLYICCRARLEGYPVMVLSDSGFFHRIGESLGGGKKRRTLRTNKKRRFLTERNKIFVMAVCYPSPFFELIFPFHLLFTLLEGVLLTLIKRDGGLWREIYSKCLRSTWAMRRRLVRRRRQVQARRKIGNFAFFAPFTPVPYKLRMLLKHGLPDIT